jgi:hypothetical protein
MNFDLAAQMFPFPGPDPLPPFPPAPLPPIPFPPPWKWPPDRPVELPDIKVKWPIRYGPAQVKILIVMDGGSYNLTDGFGLGIMLRDAFDATHPDHPDYVRFAFTKAHRTTFPAATKAADEAAAGITPNFSSFTFSDASLAEFHEVWLFGVSTAQPYIQGTELDAITKFMNNGGGVLAMGDHEDLGLGLCGNIPRVKSMRKWWYNAGRPPTEPKAPDSTDLTRNDTVQFVGGADPGFNGQSDGAPQPVYPNYRYGRNWWNPRRWFRYPHPVLCGPRGVITVFPDHAHEGDCIVPAALDPAQYPGGIAPEVIATGRNVVGRTKGGFTITDPRAFGLLGAYDGHLVSGQNPGRIVVDSTWHHWFNINLIGLDAPTVAAQTMQYRDILAYFRNVAVWLAPKERQERMRLTGQLIVLFTPSMIETTLSIRELAVDRFILWGIEARDALGRLAPKCQANVWFFELLAPHLPKLLKRWPPDPEIPPDPWQAYVEDYLLTTALGGAVAALALAARKYDYLQGDELIASADKIMAEGIRMGIEHAHRQLEKQTGEFRKHVEVLRESGQRAS